MRQNHKLEMIEAFRPLSVGEILYNCFINKHRVHWYSSIVSFPIL